MSEIIRQGAPPPDTPPLSQSPPHDSASPPGQATAEQLAALYKALGDPTRIRILFALLEGEQCVGDVAALLSMEQSAVSHQLKTLKTAGILRARRDGKSIYYAIANRRIRQLFRIALAPGETDETVPCNMIE